MIKYLITILLLNCTVLVFSQDYADKNFYLIDSLIVEELSDYDKDLLDSCLSIYNNSVDDTYKTEALLCLGDNLQHDIWVSYQLLAHEIVLDLIKNNNNANKTKALNKLLGASCVGKGYVFDYSGNNDSAKFYYQKSINICTKINDKAGAALAYNNLATIQEDQGYVEKALDSYHRSIKLYEEIGDKGGISLGLHNIGLVYTLQGELDYALKSYNTSLALERELYDLEGVAKGLTNKGYIFEKMGKIDSAFNCFNEAMEISENMGDLHGVATASTHVGALFRNYGDTINREGVDKIKQGKIKAINLFERSLKIFEDENNRMSVVNVHNHIGGVLFDLGKIKEAKKHGLISLKIAKELGYPRNIKNSAMLLSKVYKAENEGMKALEMYQLYSIMKDSILSITTHTATIREQEKYNYESKKLLNDKENEKKIEIEHQMAERQRILAISISVVLILVVIFLYFIYKRLQITRRQKVEIESSKKTIESQKEILEDKSTEINLSINYAQRIQQAVLPEIALEKLFPDSFLIYKPKDIVSGDFYWWEETNDYIIVAVVDCTGHGVPGGFMSMLGSIFLNEIFNSKKIFKPSKILDELSNLVEITLKNSSGFTIKDGMDISIVTFDKLTNEVQWAGAYNPLYCFINNEFVEFKADKQPIGYFENKQLFTNHSVKLSRNDSFYLFSDGFSDQFGGGKDKKFGSKRFKKLLESIQKEPMDRQKKILNDTFINWMKEGDEEQIDDVCMIGVRI